VRCDCACASQTSKYDAAEITSIIYSPTHLGFTMKVSMSCHTDYVNGLGYNLLVV